MATDDTTHASQGEKPEGFIKRTWSKLEITPFMILLAIKGALPPVIALAAYEARAWNEIYTTLGYLVAIISHLSLAIQPRAKFMQSMLVNIVFICIGAAVGLLEIQCVIAARSPPPTSVSTTTGSSGSQESSNYDSSANTVAAVWLFLMAFAGNYVKAARPQLMIPMIQYSIFVIISSVYAPQFPTMIAAESFVRRLLITFLTAYALATAVSLMVLPVTSRKSVNKQFAGLNKIFKGCLATHAAYMESVAADAKAGAGTEHKVHAKKLKALITAATGLVGKIKLEIGFARKEIAYGKLKPEHFSQIFEGMREILQPIMGLATFLGIVESLKEHRATLETVGSSEMMEAIKKLEVEEWEEVMTISRDAYRELQRAMFSGLDHVAYQLEMEPRPKQKKEDIEEKAENAPKPGDRGFAEHLQVELHKYQKTRNEAIQHWAESREIILPRRFWPNQNAGRSLEKVGTQIVRAKLNQHQLYLVLYINFLVYSIGQAILKQVKFADGLVEDGTMTQNRIILPGWKRLRRLFVGAVTKSDADETMGSDANAGTNIWLGDMLKQKKDPEHLPPVNIYERSTDFLRAIPRWLASEACAFAFRGAVATMSIAIIAFLSSTRTFFLQQRGIWAVIMTAISMDPHSGQSIFGYVARVGGTVVAMTVAIIIWYMCDHNHAGILVVFAIQTAFWVLFIIKKPAYAVVGMISSVTVILIIGYELQVDVVGIAVATSNGQEFYPVYLLGPYRFAAVCIGLGIAFFWTFFPYPLTTHGSLRRDTGSTLYILANFYSCVHTTLDARLQMGPAINDLPATHPVKNLDAARKKVFSKCLLMLARLREYHRFTKFEPQLGGRFPGETYDELITSMTNVFTYLALIVYSSQAFIRDPGADGSDMTPEEIVEERRWLHDFRDFAADTSVTSHGLTSTLCLLSASMRNAQPLPPYLRAPRPFDTAEKIESIDPELLGVQHFAHPCYAAFAVGEVASAFVTAEVTKITRLIKELVGEVDFSFHIVSTADDGKSATSTLRETSSVSGSDRGSAKMKDS